jgi:hypothetical protein
MAPSPCITRRGTTFSLNVTLDYGADNKTEEELNKACPKESLSLSEMASSFFSGSLSSSAATSFYTSKSDSSGDDHNQDKFFVASASHVRLCEKPSEKFWKTNAHLILVFVPPHMIASALEEHFSSNQVAMGSSFWINRSSSANFAKDLLPKIHPTALTGCRILGIVLTSIAASNGPAELMILEVPKEKSIQDDILKVTNGCTIVGDSDLGILKILPLATVAFTHEEDDDEDDGKALYSEQKMGHSINTDGKPSPRSSTEIPSTSTKSLQIPACPVCIHRIDPIRFGLPGPRVHQLCSTFCPSPSLGAGGWGAEEEMCPKQKLLVSTFYSSRDR